MSLIDKLKNAGKALALAGGLGGMAYNSGCEALVIGAADVWGDRIRADAEIEAAKIRSGQGQNKISNLIYEKEGVSRISNTPWGDIYIICCNYAEDFDKNGVLDYPRDIMGIKERFKINERICLIVWGSCKPFNGIDYKLLNQNGEIVEHWTMPNNQRITGASYNNPPSEIMRQHPDVKSQSGMINELKEGNYRSIWYSKGQLIAMHDFSVE